MALPRKKKLFSIFLLSGFCFGVLASEANATMVLNRNQRAQRLTRGHQPTRYNYIYPGYQPRKAQKHRECVAIGQARCLGPKKPKNFQSRYYNRSRRKHHIHPYLRHKYPYQAKQNF